MRQDAESVLWSFVHEPEDADARRQIQLLWADEVRRYRTFGRANYAPSPVSSALLRNYRASVAQRFATGMLAIAILVQVGLGGPKKQEAERNVLRAVNYYRRVKPRMLEQLVFERGSFQKVDSLPLASQRSIQKAHAEYRRVAHILAADLVASSFLQPIDPIDCAHSYLHRLIATAARIEFQLNAKASEHYPDLLSVIAHIPIEVQAARPFVMGEDLWSFVLSGLSGEQRKKILSSFSKY
jgi:hypothetical protein